MAALSGRLDKVERLAATLRRLSPALAEVGVAYLAGDLPQGRIGVGPAAIQTALGDPAVPDPTLTLAEVHAAFDRIAASSGPGSSAERGRLLRGVLGRATSLEREFLVRLLLGELRQGAQEKVLMEAVARASGTAAARVRRAAMLAGSGARAGGALLGGAQGAIEEEGFRLFRPIQPMLAQTADGTADALARLGRAAFEVKFDGARVQVHRSGDTVRVFTRGLNEIDAHPEIVDVVRALPAGEVVLDGEAIVLATDGIPRPFQETMSRFGRAREAAGRRAGTRLTPYSSTSSIWTARPGSTDPRWSGGRRSTASFRRPSAPPG